MEETYYRYYSYCSNSHLAGEAWPAGCNIPAVLCLTAKIKKLIAMCLYPKRIQNKKYTATKKNGGNIPMRPIIGYKYTDRKDIYIDLEDYTLPDGTKHTATGEITTITGGKEPIYDNRISYVEVPCGQCEECRKSKARDWQVRLGEEIRDWKYKYFVTFTFSPEGLREICFKHKIQESNAAAAFALRHSLERYRKDYKHSLRHWFVTELGHEGTERIHMHGLLMSNEPLEFEEIARKNNGIMAQWKYWKYGIIFVGDFVNQMSVNYVVKYMEKIDTDHKGFIGQILASPGIGAQYVERQKLLGRPFTDYYRLPNGAKVKQPKYYKNKLLNEEEREIQWRQFMDLHKESVMGTEYNKNEVHPRTMATIRAKAQETSTQHGYGSEKAEWRKKTYNITKRMIQDQNRYKAQIEMIQKLMDRNEATPEMVSTYYSLKGKIAKFEKNSQKNLQE